uniref:Uncharacterized protein n=1 Tax=Oryzias latipes TaxID=8090 RepID=A0A286P9S9_ORYLA|nr:hypothetical protein [Oryzias latipes]
MDREPGTEASVFRSVCELPDPTFRDIMDRHYGSEARFASSRRPRGGPALKTGKYDNLSAYLDTVYVLGRREPVIEEIVRAHKSLAVVEEDPAPNEGKIPEEASSAGAPVALVDPLHDSQYLDGVASNTTLSFYAEIGGERWDEDRPGGCEA